MSSCKHYKNQFTLVLLVINEHYSLEILLVILLVSYQLVNYYSIIHDLNGINEWYYFSQYIQYILYTRIPFTVEIMLNKNTDSLAKLFPLFHLNILYFAKFRFQRDCPRSIGNIHNIHNICITYRTYIIGNNYYKGNIQCTKYRL